MSDEGCSPQCASSATHEPLVPGEDLLEELKSRTLSQGAIETACFDTNEKSQWPF